MTKRQKRLLVIAVVLAIILALLTAYFLVYKRTKKLSFRVTGSAQAAIPAPEFLFSFSGEGGDRLQRPVGLMVDDGTVYVTDSVRARVFTFTEDGEFTGSFGASQTLNPLYIAKNPKDGLLYVTDRRKCTVLKFKADGTFVGEFDPPLPKDQLPKFKTGGIKWQPIAIAFAQDGTMFVTEILRGHRLLVFSPDGTFVKSAGDAGSVSDPSKGPEVFQFPNGLMVSGNEVFVADSNNQRVKVYSKEGEYKRTIVTGGLPRGLIILEPLPGDDKKSPLRFVETDTLSHYATIWTADGKRVLSFGEQGVLDGQFSYPGGLARGKRNRIFVADTSNGRVQAWGWPLQEVGLPSATLAGNAPWLLVPGALLLPLFFRRKRQFFATADFIQSMAARGQLETLRHRNRKWITTKGDHALMKELELEGFDVASLFEPVEYSESDVRALIEKYDLDQETAITLATAERARIVCVEDEMLRRLAKMLELEALDAEAFVKKFSNKAAAKN